MSKQSMVILAADVTVPDGYELVRWGVPKNCELYLSASGYTIPMHAGEGMTVERWIVRRIWWPDYLNAACVARDKDGQWYAFEEPPKKGLVGWLPVHGRTMSLKFLDVDPPQIDNWEESRIFNPTI